MSKRRLWVLLFGLTGTALGVLLAVATLGRDGRAKRPQGSSEPTEVASRSALPARPEWSSHNIPAATTTDPREVEQARKFWKGMTGELPSLYNMEPRDQAWARPMESSMRRRLLSSVDGQIVPGLGFSDLECRTTTCRIVFEYRGTDPLPTDENERKFRVNKLVGQLVARSGALGSTWHSITAPPEDEGVRATYIVRFREDAYEADKYQDWVSKNHEKYVQFMAERQAKRATVPTTSSPAPASTPTP